MPFVCNIIRILLLIKSEVFKFIKSGVIFPSAVSFIKSVILCENVCVGLKVLLLISQIKTSQVAIIFHLCRSSNVLSYARCGLTPADVRH